MTVILEFELPADSFAFGGQLELPSDVELQVEQVVPVENTVMPFSWVSGDIESFESSIEEDDIRYTMLVEDGEKDRNLYRLEWDATDSVLMDALIDSHGAVLNAEGTAEDWKFNVRFEEREDMSGFVELCREAELDIALVRVYNPVEMAGDSRDGITSMQRRTLLDAFEAGYFEIPRKTSLLDLAEEYDISDQAVSERLRRATSKLVDNCIVMEETELLTPMEVSKEERASAQEDHVSASDLRD